MILGQFFRPLKVAELVKSFERYLESPKVLTTFATEESPTVNWYGPLVLVVKLIKHIPVRFGRVIVNLSAINQNMNQVIAAGGTFDVREFLAVVLRDFTYFYSPRSVAQIQYATAVVDLPLIDRKGSFVNVMVVLKYGVHFVLFK